MALYLSNSAYCSLGGNPVPLRQVQGATQSLGKVVERREVQMPVREILFLTILHVRETMYSDVRDENLLRERLCKEKKT